MSEFKNILLTTDLSEHATAATAHAVELARKFNGAITLLYVFDDSELATGAVVEGIVIGVSAWAASIFQQRVKAVDERASEIAKSSGLSVRGVCLKGHPPTEIVRYAEKNKADCVVMATHGRTGLSHMLLGSVAERVLRLSPCPVLTVHPSPAKTVGV